jgi:hypothetical protein
MVDGREITMDRIVISYFILITADHDGTTREPPRKNLKANSRSFLSTKPDEMVDHMFCWCDFQSLVTTTLRATSHRLKGIAEKVLERRALKDIPGDFPGYSECCVQQGCPQALLHPGWTYADQDALIEQRGMVCVSRECKGFHKDRARQL